MSFSALTLAPYCLYDVCSWIESKLCRIPITCTAVFCQKLSFSPKICLQWCCIFFSMFCWGGNGKILLISFTFHLSPFQIYLPRCHKMYDLHYFCKHQWLCSDVKLHVISLSLIKGIPLQRHLWWQHNNDNYSVRQWQNEGMGEHFIMGLNSASSSKFVSHCYTISLLYCSSSRSASSKY